MHTTRKQRRDFLKHAAKQVKKGQLSKEEYLEMKSQMKALGEDQHAKLREHVLEQKGVKIIGGEDNLDIDLDAELVDDIAPEDL